MCIIFGILQICLRMVDDVIQYKVTKRSLMDVRGCSTCLGPCCLVFFFPPAATFLCCPLSVVSLAMIITCEPAVTFI